LPTQRRRQGKLADGRNLIENSLKSKSDVKNERNGNWLSWDDIRGCLIQKSNFLILYRPG